MMLARIALALLLIPFAAGAETPQDFSGEWVLATSPRGANGAAATASTDNDRAGGMGHGRGGRGGVGGRGGGMGGDRHHRGNPGTGTAPSAADVVPRWRAQALTIRQSDVVFDIAAGGQRTVYRFDNRNNYGPAYGGTVTLTWAAPEMIIETHPDAGGSIEEHYRLSDDGKQLTLKIHAQRAAGEAARDVTRIFVRAGQQQDKAPSTLP